MERALTTGEIALARSMFGEAIDYDRVKIILRKWAFFQPRETVMAPIGRIHFHPGGSRYRDDFAMTSPRDQALFIHEMVHVWQHQSGIILPIARHPWCRYDYTLQPNLPFKRYGIEQQAEITADAFLLRHGAALNRTEVLADYENVLPFNGSR